MAYLSNIPQPTDQLSVSQPQILANFTAIGTILDPDTGTVNFVKQLADPTLPANAIGLYSKDLPGAPIAALPDVPEGGPEIYVNRTDGVNNFHIPITASFCNANGYAYLPSGVLLKWGTSTATHGADSSTSYCAGADIPIFAAVLSVQLVLIDGPAANNASISMVSGTSTVNDLHVYLWNAALADLDYYYLAIGY